ncbi:type VI secretion system membrane subunit TssM, partial [Glaciimonas sp. GG7]
DVSMLLSRASGLPLTRGVSGIYSVTGYRELLKQLPQAILDTTQDSWVLDRRESEGAVTAAASGQLRAAILQLYYLDYIKQWDSLLTDVGIMPFSSLDQGARITNALAATNSPLRSFLQAASKETKLNDVGGKSAVVAVEDAVRSKLAAARNKLESALGSNQEEVVTEAITNNPVDQHFEALHKLVGTPGMVGTAPIDALLAMLKDVSQYFDAAQSAQRAGTPPPPDEVMQHLTREADGKPAPLDGMLKNIDSIGVGLTLGSERTRLQSLWNSVAAPFCQEAIAGRYPMVRSATKEVTLDDFGRFFGPAGIMDDFFSKNLASLVDTGGPRWKWRNTDGARLGVPQDVLNQFQRAAQLRDMFFPAGGRQPSLHFGLTPLSVDPALSKVDFNIDGQAVSYSADVTSPTVQIALPSGKSDHEVHLYTTPALMADLQTTGPWAWFRMLDKGTLQSSQQGERFKLTYDLDGHKVVYQLNASSVINPFRRDALEKFRCPAGW